MQGGGANKLSTLYEDLRKRYRLLQMRLQKALLAYRKNRGALKRLSRSYALLKRNYLILRQHATKRVMELVETINKEKYELVFDENRKLLSLSQNLLADLGMGQDDFSRSFYVDILFEKYLPPPDYSGAAIDIPAFQFPLLLPEDHDKEAHVHPFVHLSISGKLAPDQATKVWRYYLNAEDVSSTVELNYFQKTDKLISTLSIQNLKLQRANKTIEMHKTMLISLVCSLVGEYSKETSSHLKNLQTLTACLSAECKRRGLIKVEGYSPEEYVKDINYTSVLHDIGKMAIPSGILEKDGALTKEELSLVRKHPEIGANYIKRIMDIFEDDPLFRSYVSFLRIPYEICRYHHEQWDGSGYPEGLSGDAIPLPARIVAVADTYEAIRGKRSYNHIPRTHQEALDIIAEQAGKQFDPKIVEAFLAVNHRFAGLH